MNATLKDVALSTQASRPSSIGEAEWQTRVDLAACYRLVDHFGWTDLIYNHISARVPGEHEHFLINPFGMLYEEITASSLIKVDIDGNVISNGSSEHAETYTVNRAGYVIHSAIHKARPDVQCVLHTHTVAGMGVSSLKCGLLPLSLAGLRFSDIGYHDLEGIVTDLGEQERLAGNLGDREALILRNHGLLVVGSTIAQAFGRIDRLERACQTQLAAMACNTDLNFPTADVVARTRSQLKRSPTPDAQGRIVEHGAREWPALLRLLDRRDPSYRH